MRKLITLIAAAAIISASMASTAEARGIGYKFSKHAVMKTKAGTSHKAQYLKRHK